MDLTKFFDPVQKFTTYLVDRVSLILITCLLLGYVIDASIIRSIWKGASYQPLLTFLDGSGITGDNLTILVIIVVLLIFVAALEIHERLLQLLHMFSPIHFSTRSYYGEADFLSFAPLVWRGYCRKLNLAELSMLFHLTVSKLKFESQTPTRRTEIFDLIPAWLFLLLLIYIFSSREMLAISTFGLVNIAVVFILTGFVWELFMGRHSEAEMSRVHYLALAALIERKAHDFEELSNEQNAWLEERRKTLTHHARPWRVPVIRCPWIAFVRDVAAYIQAQIAVRALKAHSHRSWVGRLFNRKGHSE